MEQMLRQKDNDQIFVDAAIAELIPEFIERRKEDAKCIFELLEKRNLEGLMQIGHKLKGSCLNYGFCHLASLARKIELSAQCEDLGQVHLAALEMQRHLNHLRIHFTKTSF